MMFYQFRVARVIEHLIYKEYYLVSADSASYAEAQVHQILKGENDFTVISTKQSKITTVRTVDVDGKVIE